MAARQDSEYFPLMDGIRGVAAIAVMFRHMQALGVHSVAQSYLGVDVFFALSGAVIASAYERKLLTGMRTRDFLRRRILRLWPMIAIGVALGTLNAAWGQPEAPMHGRLWLYTALALVLWGDNPFVPGISLNRPSWTMAFEFLVNIVYAKVVRFLNGPIILAVCGGCAVVLGYGAWTHGGIDIGGDPDTLVYGAARTGFAFFLGVGLYRLHRAGRLPVPAPLQGGRGVVLCTVLLLACLFVPAPHGLRWIVSLGSVLVLVPMIVSLGLESRVGAEWAKPCLALGALSYPLYLIHDPLAMFAGAVLTRSGHVEGRPVVVVVFAVTVPALAWAVHRWVDEPLRAWLGRRLPMRAAPTILPAG